MSGETSTVVEEIQIEDEVEEIEDDEEEEVEEEDEDVEEEEEEEEIEAVTHGRSTGRGLTLKTLLKEGVLQPGEGTMTINYLGNKFKGDLLPDGRIRSQETSKIFGTPSAWAIYCKKIVNPDKKSGCGWASVRYRGKKLDSYKNNWYRQKRLEFEREGEALDEEEMTDSDSDGPHEQEIVEFELIGNRHPNHDMNTMVELTSFQSLGRMQPFTVTMSSSAMAVIDVHAHLSTSEVVGYLAGQWDVTNHNLIVSHALPVRCRLGDGEKGNAVEKSIYDEMEKLNLSLVGWYHTHPFSPPLPTLRDIDSQLEYEMKMKGSNDASYTPCIGIIVSPYVRGGGQGTTTSGFWVMPPPEHKPQEYGRPMSIQFTIVQDAFIPKDALIHVRDTVKYYKDSPDCVVFTDIFQDRYTYWDKLKTAIRMCVPKDHFGPLLDYLAKLLELKNYVNETNSQPPAKSKNSTSVTKSQDSTEGVSDEQSGPSSSVPDVEKMTTTSEDANNVENQQPITSPDSACPTDMVSESVKEVQDSPPDVQQMEVSFTEEPPERSPSPQEIPLQKPPSEPEPEPEPEPVPEPEPKEDYQPVSYQQQSPPPYLPPPYQPPQYHSAPFEPPLEETTYQEQKQKQELLQQQEFYQEEHKQKLQEEEEDYDDEPIIEEESSKYAEPPPDYHQQHYTISSTYEPTTSEPYTHEESTAKHAQEKNISESMQSGEESPEVVQYPDSITIDPWSQRIGSDSLQTSLQSKHFHQPLPSSRQLHQQSQPLQLHQSQSLQLHQQSHSQQLHQQSQSQQLHEQLQSQQLLQPSPLQLQQSQIHQLLKDRNSEHEVVLPMDVDSLISQSQN